MHFHSAEHKTAKPIYSGLQFVTNREDNVCTSYRTLPVGHLIGQGGMANVFLAQRTTGEYSHQVAIKLVRNDIVNPNISARFESERQILAILNHPNIAHLIDSGTSSDGIPYLVMQYINGKSIDVYCTANQLNTNKILKSFLTICTAVQYDIKIW